MSEQALAVYNGSTALLVSESEKEIKEAARKLMRLTPAGNRLNADQATDLAVYSFLTGLNPFNNECYYMDKVGPVPGIAGYRTKAVAWLRATSPRTPSPRVWEEYRPATTDEADFDPDAGDVAWVCTVFDSVSKERWEQRMMELGFAYHKMGASFQEAYDTAKKDVGPCPCWTSVGVVHADEHFSGNVWRNNVKVEGEYKPEMWDRNERAKKRAAKGCYRKGFPEVNIPDIEEGEVVDAIGVEIKQKIVAELADGKPELPTSEGQIMSQLGFDPDPKTQAVTYTREDAARDMQAEQGQVIDGEAKEPQPEKPWTNTVITLEMAMTETSSDKGPYWNLPTEDLSFRYNSLQKSLAKNGMTPEQQEVKAFKRDVLKAILDWRAQPDPEAY